MPASARLHAAVSALLVAPLAAALFVVSQEEQPVEVSGAEPIATASDRRELRERIDGFLQERRVEAAGTDVAEAPAPPATPAGSVWDRLADCESGDWDAHADPIPGSARWDYGLTFDHGDSFEGGLNFHPGTWDAFRDPGMADHAGNATRAQQIVIGERVLDAQGWGAWPVCSRKLGLR